MTLTDCFTHIADLGYTLHTLAEFPERVAGRWEARIKINDHAYPFGLGESPLAALSSAIDHIPKVLEAYEELEAALAQPRAKISASELLHKLGLTKAQEQGKVQEELRL